MIPRWKLRRELDRIRRQILALAGPVWEPLVQRRYDRNRARNIKLTLGLRPLRERVAVYLLFQPDRLLDSTLDTCRLMDEAGYSILIVSNAPLSSQARAQLAQCCWKVMERPNYGYDFGGYRDGILHLMELGIQPEWLLVLNDSVWFPLHEGDGFLARLETSDVDVSGTIVHRSFGKSPRRRMIRVIESYFFLFGARAFMSEAFRDFWMNYRLSSNKYNAVHRGERRVAEVMLAAGFRADGMFGREEFLRVIAEEDAIFLYKVLRYSNYTNNGFAIRCKELMDSFDDSPAWRKAALDHIHTVANEHSFFASFPFVAAGKLGVPLIKRSSGALQILARRSVLAAIQAGDLPPFREPVMGELRASVDREFEVMIES